MKGSYTLIIMTENNVEYLSNKVYTTIGKIHFENLNDQKL
jgi:hypothetical protein